MALFGRRSARQRLRSAARESLTIPAFSAPVDCTAWVLGGLWPAELSTVTPATAQLAEYLNTDLQRIAHSANEKLHAIGRSGLAGQARQTAESRVINVARAFAVLRVESTVRYLHNEALEFRPQYASLNAVPPPAQVTEQIPAPVEPEPVAVEQPGPVDPPRKAPGPPARHRMPEPVVVEAPPTPPPVPAVVEPVPEPPVVVEPVDEPPVEVVLPVEVVPVVEVPVVEVPVVAPPPRPIVVPPLEPVVALPPDPTPVIPEPPEPTVVIPAEPEPTVVIPEPPAPPVVIPAEPEPPVVPATAPPAVAESDDQRLQRLLAFVARQEPGLCWAIGSFADGKTVLVTDLAHGWIPSGIELPAEVQLLGPEQRTGTAAAMLGGATASAVYQPGDRLGWASDFGVTESSVQPRELDAVDDLGWQLSEATHWREGLPRMANTLVKAGATGTGVVDAEIDLLRVHLDTARYQLLAQYPDIDAALMLNCMLLAATEGIAAGDGVSANYHYSWFRALSAPQPSQWDPQK